MDGLIGKIGEIRKNHAFYYARKERMNADIVRIIDELEPAVIETISLHVEWETSGSW